MDQSSTQPINETTDRNPRLAGMNVNGYPSLSMLLGAQAISGCLSRLSIYLPDRSIAASPPGGSAATTPAIPSMADPVSILDSPNLILDS